jgi:5-methylcytosine-specific restriction protein A
MVTKPNVEQVYSAIDEFEKFGMPDGYGEPSRYYVQDPRSGNLYPQKAIYGLAFKLAQDRCPNATDTRLALAASGFVIVDSKELKEHQNNFNVSVSKCLNSTPAQREARLANAPRRPKRSLVAVVQYQRNPDVVAQRLSIAGGSCEACGEPAPFIRKTDGTPFLEVHHVIPLSDEGEDTIENTLALCPNCHRKAHFG